LVIGGLTAVIAMIATLLVLMGRGPAAHGMIRIAYIAPISGSASSYWQDIEEGLIEGSRGLPVVLTFFPQSRVDERLQLAHFEQAVRERYDGIITMALNPESFTPVINRAVGEGLPVVLLDGDAPNSQRLAFFGSNNYEAGLIVARLIESLVDGDVRLGVVTAGITLRHITDRLDGIQTWFDDRSDLHISRIEDSRADETIAFRKAIQIMEETDVNIIFAAGAVDSLGVAAAIIQASEAGRNVLGIGFDDTPETLAHVAAGTLAACIAQSPFEMGRLAVQALTGHLAGEGTMQGIHYTPVTVVISGAMRQVGGAAHDH
jgi:ribose transport system substrate-binding protein